MFGSARGILVGTQMLAKGHDLPNLTLVAVVGIDEGLFSADFRAPEKLAQLLIQVAGRAGRADKPGEVLLQTHHPGHPLLATLLAGGYGAFAQAELVQREDAGFPPFAHIAMLRAEARQADMANAFLQIARGLIEALVPSPSGRGWREAPDEGSGRVRSSALAPNPHPPRVLPAGRPPGACPEQSRRGHLLPKGEGNCKLELNGPLPAPLPRRAGYQRAQLLVSSPERRALHAALDAALPALYASPEARKVRWSLDIDPLDLY